MISIKVYISFDFEGLGGITQWSDVTKKDKEYKQDYAIRQLRALLEPLKNHEVTLSDSHAEGDNIPWTLTDNFSNIKLISGGIRKYYMMNGIDESFDRAIFFGYHSGVGERYSTMDHTYSSSSIHNIWINNIEMNETLINAAYAGIFDVPLTLVVGDDKLKKQLNPYFKTLYYVETKRSLGRYSAEHKPMKLLLEEIKNTTENMLSKGKEQFDVFKFNSPVEMKIEFSDTSKADMVESMPLVERLDGRRVRITNTDYKVIFEALLAMTYICES